MMPFDAFEGLYNEIQVRVRFISALNKEKLQFILHRLGMCFTKQIAM